ncbi:prokineticin receptor 2-like [Saccoglossus kowalevskii]|uniref:Neuropeptide FF receptor 2-like n=1 Tax=Saccoglossus kowalevskii TaxID=10224 RepID=A0ABM0GJW8_SACKO|nr:PREDICTED: neuropeptide FF receptor 2-like [Saccoglossus kowalevskii]
MDRTSMVKDYYKFVFNCTCDENECYQSPSYLMFRELLCQGVYNESVSFNGTIPDYSLFRKQISFTGRVLLGIAYTAVIILSLCGNVVVVITLSKIKRPRNNMNAYLINLAVADILMAMFCMPFTLVYIVFQQWMFEDILCPIVQFTKQVSVMVSIFTLMVVGIDRYRAVALPLQTHINYQRYRKVVIIGLVWSIAILLSTVQLITVRAVEKGVTNALMNESKKSCSEVWADNQTATIAYEMFIFGVIFLSPFFVFAVTYGGITRRLWSKSIPGQDDRNKDAIRRNNTLKIIRMVLMVVCVFFICWLPLQTLRLVIVFDPDVMIGESGWLIIRLYLFVHLLAMSHSFVNPFIYTFLHENFKKDAREAFMMYQSCCTKHNAMSFSMSSSRSRTLAQSSMKQSSRLSKGRLSSTSSKGNRQPSLT